IGRKSSTYRWECVRGSKKQTKKVSTMGAHGWSSARVGWVVWGYFAFFCGELFPRAEAGCRVRKSPSCCTGRNNDCFEYTRSKTLCYCDGYCQKTGDCCEDYRRVCQISAIDCEVGPWGPWSPCTSSCGVGSTERSRQVSVPPRNEGRPCPDLKQRRGCFGNAVVCRRGTANTSVPKLLPAALFQNSHLCRSQKNARTPSYCVYLRVKRASVACQLKPWSAQLVKERLVCAECQGDAMSKSDRCGGDGIQNIRTFWSAASVPGCHGSWVRETSSEVCRCPRSSVLFV
uniref:Si:dkey-178e17.3 n=1 Tax=Tetraodon nigroviridis TaxID=99883 RepID=H3DD66_TETNG